MFKSLSYNNYWSFVAPHDFTLEDVRNLTTPALQDCFGIAAERKTGASSFLDERRFDWDQQILQIEGSKSERISAEKCHKKTETNSQSGYKGIIFLTSNRSMSDGGAESVLRIEGVVVPGQVWATPFVNSDPKNIQDHECIPHDNSFALNDTIHVTECLAFEGKSNCHLFYSPVIAAIVIVATFVKVIAIFLAARIHKSRSSPLLTTGDAIVSFLEDPDETTKGMCWASLDSIKRGTG